jgi:hypothetical protein
MRHIHSLLLLSALSACGSSNGPRELVKDGAVLAGVSYDQKWVASMTGATRQPNGTWIGSLQVAPAAGGAPIVLDPMATAASFARGTTLYFLGGVTVAQEGTPALPRYYGKLEAWVPGQTAPIVLGGQVATANVAQSGASVVYIDQPMQGPDAVGDVKAWSAASCSATGCAAPITIATGVTSSKVVLRVDDDGGQIVVGVAKGGATTASIALVTFPAGTMQSISTDTNARTPQLSRDGATVSWLEKQNELHVLQTATPTAVPEVLTIATASVPAPIVENAIMIDNADWVAKAKASSTATTADLYMVTQAQTTPLGITNIQHFNVVDETPADTTQSARWLFYSTMTATNGQDDLWLVDLMTPTAPAVQLATVGAAVAASFNDDGTAIHFFDNYDPTTRTGDLYTMTLPGGTKTPVATGLRAAAWEPGTSRLAYLAAPDATTGVGALTIWDAGVSTGQVGFEHVANFAQSRTTPDFYYTLEANGPTDGVYVTDKP